MPTRKPAAQTKPRARSDDSHPAPWDRDNPKGAEHEHLSPQAKREAKRRADEAGRPYPNLVDNMQALKDQKEKKKDKGS